jgi:hypothetical protein
VLEFSASFLFNRHLTTMSGPILAAVSQQTLAEVETDILNLGARRGQLQAQLKLVNIQEDYFILITETKFSNLLNLFVKIRMF